MHTMSQHQTLHCSACFPRSLSQQQHSTSISRDFFFPCPRCSLLAILVSFGKHQLKAYPFYFYCGKKVFFSIWVTSNSAQRLLLVIFEGPCYSRVWNQGLLHVKNVLQPFWVISLTLKVWFHLVWVLCFNLIGLRVYLDLCLEITLSSA